MPRDDDDDWVAVAPEHQGDTQKIKAASSAYQFYSKCNFVAIQQELRDSGAEAKVDVGTVTKEVSARWAKLAGEERGKYEEMARQDRTRFERESRERDDEVARLQELKRKENSASGVVDEGSKRSAAKAAREEFERRAAQAEERKANYKARAPTAAQIRFKEKAQREKDEREAYISKKRIQVRKERSKQAKRRLEYLLKQSNIFSHFGEVKEDESRFLSNTSGTSRRRNEPGNNTLVPVEEEEAEAEAVDADEATFLTSQPSTLGFGKMRDYQLEGLNWMIRLQEHGVNGILADEMGLGKTLQSISILVYMKEYCTADDGGSGPHLIIVPKSTLSNWMNELKRWAPTLTAVKFHGSREEREKIAQDEIYPGIRDEDRTWDVIVTTYEVVNTEKTLLMKFAWSYLIIDEAHRLKNEASVFSQNVRNLETRYRLLLTGTPLQNNLHELWALLNFLVPDVFSSAEQFDEWFNLDIDDVGAKNRLISQLHKILRPFMLRRLKVDVEKSLPPKHETILFTGMSTMQKKVYRDILMRDIDTLQGTGKGSGRTALLNIVMQLRKCAGHPYLFPGIEDRSLPPLGEHLVESSGKMVLLDKLLKRLQEKGHRVLLFTQMTRLLDILEDYLVMRQFKYCRIDGNTPYEVREDSIDLFNAPDSEKFLFLLSTRAGGLGINLQTADVVILFDSDWNPQADLQAQDRAHRIGQKRPVQVFRFVTEHTIEEKIVERAQQKLKLDAMVVQQGRLKDKDNKLSNDELLKAVRFGADKIFKSEDATITDDDIDLILDIGKKKTEALNEKLKEAEKGDLLDFKLGAGESLQTFEGIDYSQAQAQAQSRAEMLGILDIGKRERNVVKTYNESILYQQAADKAMPKVEKKKKIRLPKAYRLPRMDEWQMYDRERLNAIQEEEEALYKKLLEEEKISAGVDGISDDIKLLSDEVLEEKKNLLKEGFADWSRQDFVAFVKASATFGREEFDSIANIVGKPLKVIEGYASKFWGDIGKSRISEKEYERAIIAIERGEKKLNEVRSMEKGTSRFVSLFYDPWSDLEFTPRFIYKDKSFTEEEDRFLLCWSHKFGHGMWRAIRFAIRRCRAFRFNYHMRSLTEEAIGRRCEQLMRTAVKEIDHLEQLYREEAGLPPGDDEDDNNSETETIQLPKYSTMMAQRKAKEEKETEAEKSRLEAKVDEIEAEMKRIQARLRELERMDENQSKNDVTSIVGDSLSELVNLVASSGNKGINVVAKEFSLQKLFSLPQIKSKIDEIAIKEKRESEGDTKPMWYIKSEFAHLVDLISLRKKRKLDSPKKAITQKKKKRANENNENFPQYDGIEPPREAKKDFTLFCITSRREVKASLKADQRKDKKLIHKLLKEKWEGLDDEEKDIWKRKEAWDKKRFDHESKIFKEKSGSRSLISDVADEDMNVVEGSNSIPKKSRRN